MIREYSKKNQNIIKNENAIKDEEDSPPTGSKIKMFMEIKKMIDIRNKQYFEFKV